MLKIHSERIYVNYGNFYISDVSFDPTERINQISDKFDEIMDDDRRKKFKAFRDFIYINTKSGSYWSDFYLSDTEPECEDCERMIALNFRSLSGKVRIPYMIKWEFDRTFNLPKGKYTVYILVFNYGKNEYNLDIEEPLTDEELEQRTDLEHYKFVFVPGQIQKEGVIKGLEYLY